MTSSKLSCKNILIIHFRVGKTDGVSLQIASWQEILKKKGAIVKLCSGPKGINSDYVIQDLENQLNPLVFSLDEQAFGNTPAYKSSKEFTTVFNDHQKKLKKEFLKVFRKFRPDYLIVSNIFSVGENLAAAGALTQALDMNPVETLAVCHDFYWEEIRYKRPSYPIIKNQLKNYFPPKRPFINIVCINSIAKKELMKRKNIKSFVFHDTFDFQQPPWKKDVFNKDLLRDWQISDNDLVILQATRVVRRKNIELSIDFTHHLSERLSSSQKSMTTYKNTVFDPKTNKVWLILAGYTEKRDLNYLEKLLVYSQEKGINLLILSDKVNAMRSKVRGHKKYSLWDTYPFADFVTFPSSYEGFGNQFLEATFAKKPVVVFEYPVFRKDIKPKGFQVISLGSEIIADQNGWIKVPPENLEKAAEKAEQILGDSKKYQYMVNKNFHVGKKYFSHKSAGRFLEENL